MSGAPVKESREGIEEQNKSKERAGLIVCPLGLDEKGCQGGGDARNCPFYNTNSKKCWFPSTASKFVQI